MLAERIDNVRRLLLYYYYMAFGKGVRLEASSMCQLKCPICPTSIGLVRKGIIGWSYLKFEDFKRFVDANPNIRNIELSNRGEMFLNPELSSIIRYAYSKKIRLTAWNGVNMNTVTRQVLEDMVRYKFRVVHISIDGATDKTYKVYRKNGDLNKVLKNIRILQQYKKKFNSKFPILRWQFIIFGHNQHELARAKAMAKRLGMTFVPKLNWHESYSQVVNRRLAGEQSGYSVFSQQEFRNRYGREYYLPCEELWTMPKINWDGKLLGCCYNRYSDFGNVFESGLKPCLESERYNYAKKMLLGERPPREDIPCVNCQVYKRKISHSGRQCLKILDFSEQLGLVPNHKLSKIVFLEKILKSSG
jgi:MoaA/NifB/PqqE/SkfB family radical SAM enzyme